MELGEPDSSGRRRPVPIEGSEFEIPASAIISAISQSPDFTGFEPLVDGRDWISVDERGATKVDGVWAGGDVTQLDLVTTAVGHGRRAAEAIELKLLGEFGLAAEDNGMEIVKTDRMHLDQYQQLDRLEPAALALDQRLDAVDTEVNLGFSADETVAESRRCLSCGLCFDCEKCWMYCQDQAIDKPMEKGVLYTFKLQNCTGCKKCAEICPCGFIDML
jgi:Pyruvate/2-oxoacid:ferredoxin oxidoreductase delta subunit